jgi:DNA-binding MarR family transcriptional regulator
VAPSPENRQPDFAAAAALREALREFAHRSERIIRSHGLTLEQYQLLLLIHVKPRDQATIGNLHKELRRGQSAVTQLARRMENRGLITRELSRQDARIRFLKLTERGRERLTAAVIALEEERSSLLDVARRLSALPGDAASTPAARASRS